MNIWGHKLDSIDIKKQNEIRVGCREGLGLQEGVLNTIKIHCMKFSQKVLKSLTIIIITDII